MVRGWQLLKLGSLKRPKKLKIIPGWIIPSTVSMLDTCSKLQTKALTILDEATRKCLAQRDFPNLKVLATRSPTCNFLSRMTNLEELNLDLTSTDESLQPLGLLTKLHSLTLHDYSDCFTHLEPLAPNLTNIYLIVKSQTTFHPIRHLTFLTNLTSLKLCRAAFAKIPRLPLFFPSACQSWISSRPCHFFKSRPLWRFKLTNFSETTINSLLCFTQLQNLLFPSMNGIFGYKDSPWNGKRQQMQELLRPLYKLTRLERLVGDPQIERNFWDEYWTFHRQENAKEK